MPIRIPPIPVIPEPENSYDKSLVALSLSPRITDDHDIEAVMTLRAMPYRVLADGSIDPCPGREYVEQVNAVFAQAATDPVLAQAAFGLMQIIQDYLTARLTAAEANPKPETG